MTKADPKSTTEATPSAAILDVGSGGYGAVVAEALRTAGRKVIGFVDDRVSVGHETISGIEVVGDDFWLEGPSPADNSLALGVGFMLGDGSRSQLYEQFSKLGFRFETVIRPSAAVSASAKIEAGAQILAGAIDGEAKGAGEVCLDGRKYRKMAFRARPTHQNQAIGPLRKENHYNGDAI